MRVGVLLEQLLAPVPGGTGRYSGELAAALVRTGGPDDEVSSWVAWHRDRSPARLVGVAGPARLPLPRRALAAAWGRRVGPAPGGVELVHAPTLLAPPPRRAALVVTIHDAVPWTHPETLTPHGAAWHRTMAAHVLAEGAAIAVPSHAVASELLRVLPALAPDRVHVLGGGVSLAPDPGDAVTRRVLADFGLPSRFLLFVGTLEPRKGLDVLVEALALLGEDRPLLVVAGPAGWGGVDLDALVREHGLPADAVRALGRVSDLELGVLLRAARCLVAPSRSEGFGLPVAEAMAAGTAVVCSDIAALAELGAGAARLVTPGDPAALALGLAEVVAAGELRERLSRAGLARAAEFSWDAVAIRAWTLYRQLVN